MNICMFCAFYPPYFGGAEVFAREMATRLVRDGHQVTVITGRWRKDLPEKETIDGATVHRIPVVDRRGARLFSYALSASIKGGKLAKDADLLHANLVFSAGFAAAAVKGRVKKPLLITVQGGDMGDYKEGTGRGKLLIDPLISWSLKKADLVHAISRHTERMARKAGAKKIVVIPLGYDPNLFYVSKGSKRKHSNRDPVILAGLSRLIDKNGMDYLLKAMPTILEKLPNTKLIVAGEGPQRLKLERLMKELDLNKNVELIGAVSRDKASQLLRSSDMFIRPSIDEGMGVAFVEAMACRVPTIGTNVGGIPDVITHNKTGLLLPPADSSAISNAVVGLWSNKKRMERLADNGYKYVRSKYTWDIIFAQMMKLYKGLARK